MKIKFQQFDCQNSDKDKEAWIKIPVNLHLGCNQYSIHNKVRSLTLSQNRRCDFRRRTLLYFKIHKFSSNCMLTRINVCHLRRLIFLFYGREVHNSIVRVIVHKRNPMRSGNGLFHWESSSTDLLNISCSGPETSLYVIMVQQLCP